MTESRKIVLTWFLFTLLNVIFLMLEDILLILKIEYYKQLVRVFEIIIFSSSIIRNLLCALIAYYYSIFLTNREYN